MFNPTKLDKSLYAGIIYAGRVYNSATETKRLFLVGLLLSTMTPVRASDPVYITGNVLEFVLPVAAAGMTIAKQDWTGTWQLGKSVLVNEAATGILKYTVKERRPNGEDNYSYPSGHTSISCTSAEFLRNRYGWWYGAPMYALAAFVGYSRIESKHHYFHDVLAGAVLGIASSFIFTTPYHDVKVSGSAVADGFTLEGSGTF